MKHKTKIHETKHNIIFNTNDIERCDDKNEALVIIKSSCKHIADENCIIL